MMESEVKEIFDELKNDLDNDVVVVRHDIITILNEKKKIFIDIRKSGVYIKAGEKELSIKNRKFYKMVKHFVLVTKSGEDKKAIIDIVEFFILHALGLSENSVSNKI